MTAIDFPNNPIVNQTFTVGDRTWKWTGSSWDIVLVTTITGPQGPQGLAGTPGEGVPVGGTTGQILTKSSSSNYDTTWADLSVPTYEHVQGVVSSYWEVNHNLGYYPNVVIKDSAGSFIEADINYTSINQLIITLSVPLSGVAYLS